MEHTAPDISVIIPIYNVEEYLEACLDSVVEQTKDNLEVILIDDGSQDGSSEIAKRYAQTYSYFHYHCQENGGLGRARNVGDLCHRQVHYLFGLGRYGYPGRVPDYV